MANNIAAEEPRNSFKRIYINVPPSKDSSKNIVNILNDDCLQKIFSYLDDIVDFLHVAEVCTRFQDNAKLCFPFKHIKLINCDKWPYQEHELSFRYLKRFLSIFGALIKTIQCHFVFDSHRKRAELNHYTLKAFCVEQLGFISEYCARTLIELVVVDCYAFEVRLPFLVLKKLELLRVNMAKINPFYPKWLYYKTFCMNTRKFSENSVDRTAFMFPELTHLKFDLIYNADWIAQHFPKLQHIEFSSARDFTNDAYLEFQRRNPQLQSLYLSCTTSLPSEVWRNIGDRTPNIETLHLAKIPDGKHSGLDITHFSTLPNLKNLFIYNWKDSQLTPVKSLISALAQNKRSIENLEIGLVDIELAIHLSKLKTIKRLKTFSYFSQDALVEMVRKLPALEYLNAGGLDLWAVEKILKNCDQLTEMYVDKHRLPIDLNALKSIVELATGRAKVKFNGIPILGTCTKETFFRTLNELVQFDRHYLGKMRK